MLPPFHGAKEDDSFSDSVGGNVTFLLRFGARKINTGYFNSSIRLFKSSCFERHHQHSAEAHAELPVGVNGARGALVLVPQDLPAHFSTRLGGAGVEHHAAHALCKFRRRAQRHQQHQGHRERTNSSISHYS
ncbi:unnamed protein product, partial [Musa acuminata subsp. burmannicoides]